MSQLERRRNPYPWSWEIPASVCLVIAGTLTLGAHLGRAVANLLAGTGWHLPRLAQTLICLPALLAGDAGTGLTGLHRSPAPPTLLWTWIGISDVLLLIVVVLAVWWGMRRW